MLLLAQTDGSVIPKPLTANSSADTWFRSVSQISRGFFVDWSADRCVPITGKGTRSCTGMQLAYVELFVGIANFFRSPVLSRARFYETDKSHIAFVRDRFSPKPKIGCQGVRVVFG